MGERLCRFNTWSRQALAPLVLRLGLAVVLSYHGYDKITDVSTEWGAHWQYMGPPTGPPPVLRPPGAPEPPPLPEGMPRPVQRLIAFGELVCGLLLLLGFLTRLAALGGGAFIAVEWAVYGKWRRGFPLHDWAGNYNGGFEYTFVLLAVCLAVILAGAGAFSLDGLLFSRRPRKRPTAEPAPPAAAP